MTSVRSKYLVTAKDDIAVYDSWTLRPEDVGADQLSYEYIIILYECIKWCLLSSSGIIANYSAILMESLAPVFTTTIEKDTSGSLGYM